MGDCEGCMQPNSFVLTGVLPNDVASVTRMLDPERWELAEERTTELIARIQPNVSSEGLRNAIANYVQQLIMRCFPCQVYTFGSVPLKTYLPDGDIDLTVFSNQSMKSSWANRVQDALEHEKMNENAEFRVKEVHCIQAEVKIIKCLVENIVVDISFNQLGGLCTLCFLDEIDIMISQNHLFKRSIILIKAWCYYESRILGAHHGLISTYALETLVLYIFHLFNNSLAGPLEVLYRFLQFFSKFEWENFCVSLYGPVPISSLPDMTADFPRKDDGMLLLSKPFLDACSYVYAMPGGQEFLEQPFHSKHFNIVDPLRANNNLGRSVSKGNFFRIRSALTFGAQRLTRLLDCPKENVIAEINNFFKNTWDQHGTDLDLDAHISGHSRNERHPEKQFARTQSSPELIHMTNEAPSQERHNTDAVRKRNADSEVLDNQTESSLTKDPPSSSSGAIEEQQETLPMHQGEQGSTKQLVSMGDHLYAPSQVSGNVNSANPPFPVPPIVLASLGYDKINPAAMIPPPHIPFYGYHWGPHMQYSQVPLSVSNNCSSIGVTPDYEGRSEIVSGGLVSTELSPQDINNGFQSEQDLDSMRTNDDSNRSVLAQAFEDVAGTNSVHSQHQRNRDNHDYSTNHPRSLLASQSTSRSKSPVRKSVSSPNPSIVDLNTGRHDGVETINHDSPQQDDNTREVVPVSTVRTDVAEIIVSESPFTHSVGHSMPVYDLPKVISGPYGTLPIVPAHAGCEPWYTTDKSSGGSPVGYHPTGPPIGYHPSGPPVPFLSMFPSYDLLVQNNSISDKDAAPFGPFENGKFDVLNGDIICHWRNLQSGRFIQNSQPHGPFLHPSHFAPAMYSPDHFPWNQPGRHAGNMNHVTQLSYTVPFPPLHAASNRPPGVCQQYTDEMSTYQGGTRTYLPNPKMSMWDQPSSTTRNDRRVHNGNRNGDHSDRGGNWNGNSKQRFAGRGQGYNHFEKQGRIYRPPRPSFRQDSFHRNNPRNSTIGMSNSRNPCSGNTGYGMYPSPVVCPTGLSPSVTPPPYFLLYPAAQPPAVYGQDMDYGFPAQKSESKSLDPACISGLDEEFHLKCLSRSEIDQAKHQEDSELFPSENPTAINL